MRLYDGTTVLVENLVAGTLLMGPDSHPRVMSAGSLVHGVATNLFTVTPGRQSGAEPFTVCGDRVIALVNSARPGMRYNSGPVNRPRVMSRWDITHTMQLLACSFFTENAAETSVPPADPGLDYWMAAWDPL